MNYERLHDAILKLLLENKKAGGNGMLSAATIGKKLGGDIADDDIQYSLRKLSSDKLLQPLPGDDRIQAVALTPRGEAVARGDT